MNPTTLFPPYTAFLLCFGPLAVTIVAFLIFAFITDRAATATYARWLPTSQPNPYADDEDAPVIPAASLDIPNPGNPGLTT